MGRDKKSKSEGGSRPPNGVNCTDPDQYGQVHPFESAELLRTKLEEFHVELSKLPQETTAVADQAKKKCPELLTEDFLLMFLRCDLFHADLAAKRFCTYWDMRLDLFGPDKAFLPITMRDACKDDMVPLTMGYLRIVNDCTDDSGRRILLVDPSKQDKTKYTRPSMARALWYTIHAALTETGDGIGTRAQQRGIVLLIHPYHVTLAQVDRPQMKLNLQQLRGCLPVRIAVMHVCRPQAFFSHVIYPILKLFLSSRIFRRLRVHSGSYEQIVKKLEETANLSKDVLPTDIGGDVKVQYDQWLESRKLAGL